ncbi:MAG: D-inositol-3-phosphate glycosyltransferase [Planctomycetes bacterium]|nr:D-inositol-3-phosphate glycosyltransferase [Planctomycetota bacterium]
MSSRGADGVPFVCADSSFGFGGSVVALGRLLRALPEGKWAAHVIVRHADQERHLRDVEAPLASVRTVPMPDPSPPRGPALLRTIAGAIRHVRRHHPAWSAVKTVARETGARFVHANNGIAASYGAVAAAVRLRLPCVVSQRGYEWHSADTRWFARRVSMFLADSRHVADDVARLGVPEDRIRVTWAPVDVAGFRPPSPVERAAVRAELGLLPGTFAVAMTGTLLRWKGQDVFLDAAAAVARSVPDARFLLIGGDAPDAAPGFAAALRAQAAALGIAERTSFLGRRDDVARLLRGADAAVHCSRSAEPFGLVVGEAMATGLPVVASSLGGPSEQIRDGATGLLSPPGDADALARAILRLADDADLRARLGAAARADVAARFSSEAYAERVDRAFGDAPFST